LLPDVGLAFSGVGCAVSGVALCVLVRLAAVEPSLTFIEFSGPSGVAGLELLGVDVPMFDWVRLAVYAKRRVFSRRFVIHPSISTSARPRVARPRPFGALTAIARILLGPSPVTDPRRLSIIERSGQQAEVLQSSRSTETCK
jgi:hypothetical protein